MELGEAREKFIQAWGMLGSNWGINRTMSQVHALLLISPEPLSADEIMEALNISRGNTNMNVRALIDWGLVTKEFKSGERKEFFVAEKDMWQITRQVINERKKRELEPLVKMLRQVTHIEGAARDPEAKAFIETMSSIRTFATQADRILKKMVKSESKWFFGAFSKLFK